MYSVQLIHLLRDPRAMIRSRLVGNIAEKQAKKVCTAMEEDLKLADILPPDRWDHIISLYLYQLGKGISESNMNIWSRIPLRRWKSCINFLGLRQPETFTKCCARRQMDRGKIRKRSEKILIYLKRTTIAVMVSMVLNVAGHSIQITGKLSPHLKRSGLLRRIVRV